MDKFTQKDIKNMPYVRFMALLDEVNRPPGGKMSVRQAVQNGFINHKSTVWENEKGAAALSQCASCSTPLLRGGLC